MVVYRYEDHQNLKQNNAVSLFPGLWVVPISSQNLQNINGCTFFAAMAASSVDRVNLLKVLQLKMFGEGKC